MDYKYIEQLLERYWDCETSPEEERIPQTFFSQQDLPAHLVRYRDLFVYEQQQSQLHLGEDFDKRLLEAVAATEKPETPRVVKVKKLGLAHRFRPLYKAAAAVAIVTLLGNAAQHSFRQADGNEGATWDYNQSAYQDSYEDPQKAYEMSMKAFEMFKQGQQTAAIDSAKLKAVGTVSQKGN